MKNIFILLVMTVGIISCAFFAHKPKGELTFCRYYCSGAAQLGTDYCTLDVDEDGNASVSVVLNENNRFNDPVIKRTYPVDKSTVDSLSHILEELKVYKLDGYRYEEPIGGGYSHSFSIRYSSGDKVDAYWYGHKVKARAITAYNAITDFFAPWRQLAAKDGDTVEQQQ